MIQKLGVNLIMRSLGGSSVMAGGAKHGAKGYLGAFVFVLIMFLIKVWLVQYSYNYVAPRLMESSSELSYTDAVFLVILFNNLMH